ncbi:hypothetical protein ACSMX9_25930 [Streptomyces sp. LE64]|uniref:hypothetical protein n=1 Tax=Streptomyces sp. LE64 TaxID=3448653 RepID=UPI0040425B90
MIARASGLAGTARSWRTEAAPALFGIGAAAAGSAETVVRTCAVHAGTFLDAVHVKEFPPKANGAENHKNVPMENDSGADRQ